MEDSSLSLLLSHLSCKVNNLEETIQRLGAEKQAAIEEIQKLHEVFCGHMKGWYHLRGILLKKFDLFYNRQSKLLDQSLCINSRSGEKRLKNSGRNRAS